MIVDLDDKLLGKIPITRNELFKLVNSWGRSDGFLTDDFRVINKSKQNKCYDLSNLDVSKIGDFSSIFSRSEFNGDLSKWDLSNSYDLNRMFSFSKFNNDSLKNWDVSNVHNISFIFFKSIFNGDISQWKTLNLKYMEKSFYSSSFDGDLSNWDFSKIENMYRTFNLNENFENKYNNGELLPIMKEPTLKWLEENKNKMHSLNLSKEETIALDDYLISFKSINEIDFFK